MSDFLTNLAARTLAAPTLRPRTRMRYEPEADALAPPPVSDMGLHESSEAREVGAPIRVPLADSEAAEPARVPHRTARAEPAAETEMPLPSPAPRRDRPRLRPQATEASTPAPRRSDTQALPDQESAARDTREPMRPREFSPAQAEGTRLEKHEEEPPRSKPHRYDEIPPLSPDEASERQRAPRIIEGREPAIGPSPAPARKLRAPDRTEPRGLTATEEPVVHVSIGRIEVRAVVPPPTAVPAPRRNPIMTIEEYVAKRKGRS